ncbi:hypothetical protein MTR67_000642 [Solanum verrucosum]|uniref:Gag-pol polyprotein n=1 Tax=Solanum verrucosum TaxID=315347 RepID=A0AAF0PM65_SOLVR|nr:hypothetical protein MTR67_000642 [Solanum verrucosum]
MPMGRHQSEVELERLLLSHNLRYGGCSLYSICRPSALWSRQRVSVRDESRVRLESLVKVTLSMTEYEAHFFEISRHALTIVSDKEERVRQFVRGLTFSIRSYVSRESRERAFFQSILRMGSQPEVLLVLSEVAVVVHQTHSGPQRFISASPARDSAPLTRFEAKLSSVKVAGLLVEEDRTETFDDVITCIVLVCHRPVSVLLDSGSTFSYVSTYFVVGFDMLSNCMSVPIRISKLVGDSLVVDRVYRSCLVLLVGYDIWVDLIILRMVDLDIILGMDQISLHHSILDCYVKTMTLAMSGVPRVEWTSVSGSYPSKVITFIRAQNLIDRGCLSYLAFIWDTSIEPPPMNSVPMKREFTYVFPTNLPGVPSDKAIDLEPATKPISISPYRMA